MLKKAGKFRALAGTRQTAKNRLAKVVLS